MRLSLIDVTSIPHAQGYLKATAYSLSFVTVWKLIGFLLRRHLVKKKTVVYDIPNLAVPRPNGKRLKGTVVICGGGIAGLWCARICADHFEEVLIIEPEEGLQTEESCCPIYDEMGNPVEGAGGRNRARVPQYKAAHAFYPMVLQALKRFFPDFKSTIQKAGGMVKPTSYLVHIYGGKIMSPRYEGMKNTEDWEEFFITRESYERVLRNCVLKSSARIKWITGTATGISVAHDDPNRVESVTVRTRSGEEQTIPAAFVIDCSGGTQVGQKWLKRIFDSSALQPQISKSIPFNQLKKTYNPHLRYQQFRFFVPPEARSRLPIPGGYDKSAYIYTVFPRLGLDRTYFNINRLDGHRIQFYFTGWGNAVLPTRISELKDFFVNFDENEKIPDWVIEMLDILLEYKDQADTNTGPYPELSWIQFEKAPYIPSNFIAVGDSVMRVNPVFGQGCTKAAIGAICLDSMLRTSRLQRMTQIPDNFGRDFFVKQADKTVDAWDSTRAVDYQWETTDPINGEKLEDERLAADFSSLITELATKDHKIDAIVVQVRAFLAPATDLLHPSILAKALMLLLKKQLGLA